MKIVYKSDRDKETIIRAGVAFTLLALLFASVISGNSMAADATANAKSDMPAIGYPVPYALTSMIVLILGYIAMVIS